DDYVAKPFHLEEVLARIRALLRRSAGHAKSELNCGSVRLDTRTGRVTVDGNPVKLTSHEYRLLSYLMHHTGRVVSRSELVEHLYDQDFDRDSNTIEVFVGRVRKKLGVDVIQTVRGLGYLLAPPGNASSFARPSAVLLGNDLDRGDPRRHRHCAVVDLSRRSGACVRPKAGRLPAPPGRRRRDSGGERRQVSPIDWRAAVRSAALRLVLASDAARRADSRCPFVPLVVGRGAAASRRPRPLVGAGRRAAGLRRRARGPTAARG